MVVGINKAAHILNLSPSHIRKMIVRGLFPSYRMGSRIIRVDPEEIKAATRMSGTGGIQNAEGRLSAKAPRSGSAKRNVGTKRGGV